MHFAAGWSQKPSLKLEEVVFDLGLSESCRRARDSALGTEVLHLYSQKSYLLGLYA